MAFSVFYFACPTGTLFDEETQICNYPSSTKPCLIGSGQPVGPFEPPSTSNQACDGLHCPQGSSPDSQSGLGNSTEILPPGNDLSDSEMANNSISDSNQIVGINVTSPASNPTTQGIITEILQHN